MNRIVIDRSLRAALLSALAAPPGATRAAGAANAASRRQALVRRYRARADWRHMMAVDLS